MFVGCVNFGSYCAAKFAMHVSWARSYWTIYFFDCFHLQGWFEVLRLEGYLNNIKVSVVCPGVIDTGAYKRALGGKKDQASDQSTEVYNWANSVSLQSWIGEPKVKGMSTQRCTELIAIGIANQLDEMWITLRDVLIITYLSQYCPSVFRE